MLRLGMMGWMVVVALGASARCAEEESAPIMENTQPQSTAAWTLDEVIEQLKLAPRDVYLQYVVLQLAESQGKLEEVSKTVDEIHGETETNPWNQSEKHADLFSLFSGSLAVHESLQLDAMRAPRNEPAATVAVHEHYQAVRAVPEAATPAAGTPDTGATLPEAPTWVPASPTTPECPPCPTYAPNCATPPAPAPYYPAAPPHAPGYSSKPALAPVYPMPTAVPTPNPGYRTSPAYSAPAVYPRTYNAVPPCVVPDYGYPAPAATPGVPMPAPAYVVVYVFVYPPANSGSPVPYPVMPAIPAPPAPPAAPTFPSTSPSRYPSVVPSPAMQMVAPPPETSPYAPAYRPSGTRPYTPPTPGPAAIFPLPPTAPPPATVPTPTPLPPPPAPPLPPATPTWTPPVPPPLVKPSPVPPAGSAGAEPTGPTTTFQPIVSPAETAKAGACEPAFNLDTETAAIEQSLNIRTSHSSPPAVAPVESTTPCQTALPSVEAAATAVPEPTPTMQLASSAPTGPTPAIGPPLDPYVGQQTSTSPPSTAPSVSPSAPTIFVRQPNLPEPKPADMAAPEKNSAKISDLAGPEIKSHPWEEMLEKIGATADKVEVSKLSLCVPEDQYLVEFRSLTKLLSAVESGDLWGGHLATQATHVATSRNLAARTMAQLALDTDPLTRPFYDAAVQEVAITGSDLYFGEGTDITILFAVKQPEVFDLKMKRSLDAALKAHPDAQRTGGKIGEVKYAAAVTPDTALSVFAASPKPGLHVRSNSKVALQRVLQAIAGDSAAKPLGETTEFCYISALMARGEKPEDGFIYLSDPFIRRVVGAELKLTERRRMVCANHLQMLGHAMMLYRTQTGKKPQAIQELVDAGCAPKRFVGGESDALVCPCGGAYALSPDGTAVCSHHGSADHLRPCCEIPLAQVTPGEADLYSRFVEDYTQYWREYFDPIAIRLVSDDQSFRAETIILPLIDNSIYTTLKQALGGEAEPLDALPVPKSNIFTLAMRFDKEGLFQKYREQKESSQENNASSDADAKDLLAAAEAAAEKGLGNQISFNLCDGAPLLGLDLSGVTNGDGAGLEGGGFMLGVVPYVAALVMPGYVAMPAQDTEVIETFLAKLDAYLAKTARHSPNVGVMNFKLDFYHIPLAQSDANIRCLGVHFGPVRLRMFYACIGQAVYVATQKAILDELAAMKPEATPTDGGPKAHAMLRLRPENWKAIVPNSRLGWAENSRMACVGNFAAIAATARMLAGENEGKVEIEDVLAKIEKSRGVSLFCPEGGKYAVSADGKQVSCSLHGTPEDPRQESAVAAESELGKLLETFAGATVELTFLEDGLHAAVTVQRK